MGKKLYLRKRQENAYIIGFYSPEAWAQAILLHSSFNAIHVFLNNYLNLHSNSNAIYDLYFSTKIYICYTHWPFSCSKMHMLSMQLKPIICSISTPAPAWQVWCIKEKNDVALQMRLSPRAEKSHCSEIGPPARGQCTEMGPEESLALGMASTCAGTCSTFPLGMAPPWNTFPSLTECPLALKDGWWEFARKQRTATRTSWDSLLFKYASTCSEHNYVSKAQNSTQIKFIWTFTSNMRSMKFVPTWA